MGMPLRETDVCGVLEEVYMLSLMVHDCSLRTVYMEEHSNETSLFPLFILCQARTVLRHSLSGSPWAFKGAGQSQDISEVNESGKCRVIAE